MLKFSYFFIYVLKIWGPRGPIYFTKLLSGPAQFWSFSCLPAFLKGRLTKAVCDPQIEQDREEPLPGLQQGEPQLRGLQDGGRVPQGKLFQHMQGAIKGTMSRDFFSVGF